jgi:ABC-2 type transport system permease protein
MKGALAFEWTKLWTVRSTPWSLIAAAVFTLGFSALAGASAKASAENGFDTVRAAPHAAADSVLLAQLALVVLATLAITGEYASGSIRTTLHSVPGRGRMLLSKAAVVTGVIAVTGLLLSLAGTAAAAPLMGETGEFTGAEVVASALGTAGHLAALALIATGVGALSRSAAGTIITVILLLLALPELLRVTGVRVLEHVADLLPSTAGTVLMTQDTDPYGIGLALAVLFAWSLAAMAGGYAALRARDA